MLLRRSPPRTIRFTFVHCVLKETSRPARPNFPPRSHAPVAGRRASTRPAWRRNKRRSRTFVQPFHFRALVGNTGGHNHRLCPRHGAVLHFDRGLAGETPHGQDIAAARKKSFRTLVLCTVAPRPEFMPDEEGRTRVILDSRTPVPRLSARPHPGRAPACGALPMPHRRRRQAPRVRCR